MAKNLYLRELLEFYDQKLDRSSTHSSAIKSILGEDLAITLLSHYFNSIGYSFRIFSEACNQGTKNGHRLDKWIEIKAANKAAIYQVEIKNWSAHSLGGGAISPHANEEALRDFRMERWSRRFDVKNKVPAEKSTLKVLTKMKVPESYSNAKHKALLCFWEALHPDGKADPLFEVSVKCNSFKRLTIFSMSNYVRQLLKSTDVLEVQMKVTDERIKLLKRIYR